MFPKWQPISSAPKDGTRILIYEAEQGTPGTVRISHWRDDTIPAGWTGSERPPSHWLPLPLPPDRPIERAERARGKAIYLSP